MTASRHHALKSHQLAPNPLDPALNPYLCNQGDSQSLGGRSGGGIGSGLSKQPPLGLISLSKVPVAPRQSNTIQHQSQSICLTAVSPTSTAAYCTDNELPGYTDEEFETVNRIIELALHRSARQRQNRSCSGSRLQYIDTSQESSAAPSTRTEGTIVDKLTLIKSYEQTLKNQGVTPVEDSRIYKLLFRVVHESEHYLAQNRQYVKSQEMANMERLSLMQNQVNLLKAKSRKMSLLFGARQQQQKHQVISCLTQPDIEDVNQRLQHEDIGDPLDYQIQNKMEEETVKGNMHQSSHQMETITQCAAAASASQVQQEPFERFDYGWTDPTPTTGNRNVVHAFKEEEQHVPGQEDTFQSTRKITKLGLKPNFQHLINISQATASGNKIPDPVSDRQIDREIVDLHIKAGFYSRESVAAGKEEEAMIGAIEIKEIPSNLKKQDKQSANNNLIQKSASDQFIMTTENTQRQIVFPGNNTMGGQQQSSMYYNTQQELTYNDDVRTQAEILTTEPSMIQGAKPQSLSFCHDQGRGGHSRERIILNNTQPAPRNNSAQARNEILLPPASSSYKSTRYKPSDRVIDAKKTLAFKFKVEYSAVFRVYRAWNEHCKLRKRQKQLKKQLLNGLVKAINKHEEVLLAKTFRALRRAKRLNAKIQKRADYVHQMVTLNIKAFYMRLMMKKYKEVKFQRNLTALAQSHFKGSYRHRIFEEWRIVARRRKEQLQRMVNQYRRRPQSMQLLINFIGYNVMPKAQHATFDTLDFYSYCSIKKRFRPDGQRLARTVELSLKHTLRRLMTAWKEQKNRVTNFKHQLKVNMLKRVFLALDKNCALNYRLKLFKKRRDNRIEEHVIIALLQNLEKVRRLALSSQLTQNLHYGFQLKQFFSQWHYLHSFYKVGSLLKYSQKSTPLKALHLHKKRVFKRLVSYCRNRKAQKQLVRTQRQKHIVKLAIGAYNAWKHTKTQQKALKERYVQFSTKHNARLRQIYFKGVMRACKIRYRQRAYREFVLMNKVIHGLAQRVDVRRLQNYMIQVCEQTYLKNLTKRAFLAMQTRRESKENSHYMLICARQQLAARSIRAQFYAWRDAIHTAKQRKMLAVEVVKFYEKKVMRKVHQAMFYYTQRRHNLISIGQEVQTRMNQRIYRQVLLNMICKYAKNADLKRRQKEFFDKRVKRAESRFYFTWAYKYRNLKIRESHISKTHHFLVKKKMFSYWFSKSRQQYSHNIKFEQLLRQNHAQTKTNVFLQWKKYSERSVENRKLKAVSSFFFIAKALKKTLLALRMNAIQSKFNTANDSQNAPELLKNCFTALQANWHLKTRIKRLQAARNYQKALNALQLWHRVSLQANQHWEIIDFFRSRREMQIKQSFLRTLRSSGQAEARQFYLSRILRAWTYQTQRRLILAQKRQEIEYTHEQLAKQRALREWRQALFTQFALNKIAMPYCTTVLLKTAFRSLRKVTTQRRKARIFHRRSLLLKSTQALMLHQMQEAKVNQMRQQIQDRRISQVFDGFIDQCLIMQDLRLKEEDLKKRTDGILRERMYRHWFTLCQERVVLEPLEDQIKSTIREKWLLKVTYAALSRYQQIRKCKKQMYESIMSVHKKMQVERTFRKLTIYTEQKIAQRSMQQDALMLYRKHALRRMLMVAELQAQKKLTSAAEYRAGQLIHKAFAAMQRSAKCQKEKVVANGKADVFNQITLKLKMFRSLAILTLRAEKARLAAASRRTISLQVKRTGSAHRLLGLLSNQAPIRAQKATHTKLIQKSRRVRLCRWHKQIGLKASEKIQEILSHLTQKANHGQKSTKKGRQLRLKNRSRRNQRPKREKITRFRIKPHAKATSTKIDESGEEMLMVMEEMQFEDVMEDFSGGQKQGEQLQMFTKKPQRGPAVKSGAPMPQTISKRYEQMDESSGRADEPIIRTSSSQPSSQRELNSRRSRQSGPQQPEMLEMIKDLKRVEAADDDDSSLEQLIGIEDCYEETALEERKHTVFSFNQNDEPQVIDSVGTHLHQRFKQHQQQQQPEFHNGETFELQGTANSLNYVVEDKWDLFFQNNQNHSSEEHCGNQAENKDEKDDEEEQLMHTMPSFREMQGDDCEKTLSVIYDDADLARDHLQNFNYNDQQFVTQHQQRDNRDHLRVTTKAAAVHSPPYMKSPTMNSSMQATAEPVNRIMQHMIAVQESSTISSPRYETNNQPSKLPPRIGNQLRASNQEIDDEMRMYSTVQSYDQKQAKNHPLLSNQKSGQKNDWLQRTLQNRLLVNESSSGPNTASKQQMLNRRSGSWKPGNSSALLNSSILSTGGRQTHQTTQNLNLCGSMRSSTQTRLYSPGVGRDNKVMMKIVENLNSLKQSRDYF